PERDARRRQEADQDGRQGQREGGGRLEDDPGERAAEEDRAQGGGGSDDNVVEGHVARRGIRRRVVHLVELAGIGGRRVAERGVLLSGWEPATEERVAALHLCSSPEHRGLSLLWSRYRTASAPGSLSGSAGRRSAGSRCLLSRTEGASPRCRAPGHPAPGRQATSARTSAGAHTGAGAAGSI